MSDPQVEKLLAQAEVARLQAEIARAEAEAAEAKARAAQAELARVELLRRQQEVASLASAPPAQSPEPARTNGAPAAKEPSSKLPLRQEPPPAGDKEPAPGPLRLTKPSPAPTNRAHVEPGNVGPGKPAAVDEDKKLSDTKMVEFSGPVKPDIDIGIPASAPLSPAALAEPTDAERTAEFTGLIEVAGLPAPPSSPGRLGYAAAPAGTPAEAMPKSKSSISLRAEALLPAMADAPIAPPVIKPAPAEAALPAEPVAPLLQPPAAKEAFANSSAPSAESNLPVAPKPADTKPAEAKKTEAKNTEAKAAEASPIPGKVAETKPAEAKTAQLGRKQKSRELASENTVPKGTASKDTQARAASVAAANKLPPAPPVPSIPAAPTAPLGSLALLTQAAGPPAPPPETPIIDENVEVPAYSRAFLVMGSSLTSLIIHMVLLIVLALITTAPQKDAEIHEFIVEAPRAEEELTQLLDQQLDPSVNMTVSRTTETGVTSVATGAGHGSSLDTGEKSEMTLDKAVAESTSKVKIGKVIDLGGVKGTALDLEVSEMAPGDPQAVVDSMDEAMDRITMEILQMLQKNKVLVVWLFDESLSMKDEQREIRAKIDRVYKELGLVGATKGDALMTAVASYGAQTHIISPAPTYDVAKIGEWIDSVRVDESGEEMQCYAIGRTINEFKDFASRGRRQMALIMVTDESGDQKTNISLLEATIAEAKSARCRIYVLGREAVFGYPYAYMNWIDPNTGINYWLRIDRGPETAWPEELQTDGLWWRRDAHASGFGPWEQARMARETGGIFFMLPSPEIRLVGRDDRKYALARLRPYMPDYDSRAEYERERAASPLRSKLWELINILNPHDPARQPHIIMPHHFPIKHAEFVPAARRAIGMTQRYGEYLEQVERELELLKPHREREIYPRWQANYDLIYAQVLAYKVRLYEYKAYLEYFIKNPKEPSIKPPNPRTTYTDWAIAYRQETITGDLTKSYIERSRDLFRKVIEDHHGTPWASRAQDELNRGFGVHLFQFWDDPRRGQGVKLPKL